MGSRKKKLGPPWTIEEQQIVSRRCVPFDVGSVGCCGVAICTAPRLSVVGACLCRKLLDARSHVRWQGSQRKRGFSSISHAGKFCKSWVATRIKHPLLLIFAVVSRLVVSADGKLVQGCENNSNKNPLHRRKNLCKLHHVQTL
jgi:hypothetical protein